MPQKILVIDDEKLIRWTLEQHLAKEGYEVVTADSAEKGLAIINDEAPDLIPRDNRLPEIAGLALAYGNALCTGTGPHGDHDYRHMYVADRLNGRIQVSHSLKEPLPGRVP
jgi:hypothetical protein